MTRTKRLPAERRAQLLDCAQALFFSRGYETTTVNDILELAGLSKGAFYHYFDSKEALLDALAERVAAQVIQDAEPILDDPDMDALTRLNAFLEQGRQWKIEQAPMLRAVFDAILRIDNAMLSQRILTTMGAVVSPVIVGIIEEGVREGVFDPVSPPLIAEVLLQLGPGRMAVTAEAMAAAAHGRLDEGAAALEARMAAESAIVERLLGVAPGAVPLVRPGFVRAILAAMG